MQLQRSLRGQGQLQRTHETLVWQEALDRQVDRGGFAALNPRFEPWVDALFKLKKPPLLTPPSAA